MIIHLFASAAAASVSPAAERQVEIVREVAQALIDNNETDVKRHFARDAIFAGQQNYPWSFTSFRATVLARDCALRPSVWHPEGVAGTFAADIKNLEANLGPALALYCVSDTRRATHELYTFAFKDNKIVRVTLFAVAPVPPPPPGPVTAPEPTIGPSKSN